jgi:hypothetical protein
MSRVGHQARNRRRLDAAFVRRTLMCRRATGDFQMTAVKCVLVGLALVLLAGCIIRDDDGRGYERGRGEFRGEAGGQPRAVWLQSGTDHYRAS